MKCPKNLLQQYLDHNLNAGDSKKVEDHLTQCPKCRQEYLELQRLFSLLRDQPVPEPEADFVNSIMQQIELEQIPIVSEAARRKLLARYLGWASTLVGLFSFVLIVYLFRESLYNFMWNDAVWIWSQVVVLGTDLAPNWVVAMLHTAANSSKSWQLVIRGLWQNSYMWSAAVVLGLCAWTILREIIVDVQQLFGYYR